MNYHEEEILIWKGTPSHWLNFGAYFFCVVLAGAVVGVYYLLPVPRTPWVFAGLLIPVLWAFARWIEVRSHVYEITSERIRVSVGLLSRMTTELELYRVRDYTVVEPLWLRIVGCGNIILQTADRTNPQLIVRAVPNANVLKDKIRANTERMRQLRGVRDLEIDPQ
jgi:uncharacterized membrane protein YdbT with pleckstrin-like domain